MENIESRVTDLEIQLSHQSKMIDELDEVIISQQKQIKEIERIGNFLINHLKNTQEHEGQAAPDNFEQTPPHY